MNRYGMLQEMLYKNADVPAMTKRDGRPIGPSEGFAPHIRPAPPMPPMGPIKVPRYNLDPTKVTGVPLGEKANSAKDVALTTTGAASGALSGATLGATHTLAEVIRGVGQVWRNPALARADLSRSGAVRVILAALAPVAGGVAGGIAGGKMGHRAAHTTIGK